MTSMQDRFVEDLVLFVYPKHTQIKHPDLLPVRVIHAPTYLPPSLPPYLPTYLLTTGMFLVGM
jgi:hypothetical protein